MDALAGLLDGPRARGAFLLRSVLDPPWSMRIEDEAPLTLVAVVAGEAWVRARRRRAGVRLGPGDVAIVRGPDPYTVADDPATAPQVVIHARPALHDARRRRARRMRELGVRTWGNSADGATVLLTGTYSMRRRGEPAAAAARCRRCSCCAATSWDCPLVGLLADEIVKDEPGQEAVLDRLLDLLLIAVLRAWFARPEAAAPGWYRAHADPVVGPRAAAAAPQPGAPVDGRRAGAARPASRGRRWPAGSPTLVGEPPMAFLTGWRLALAADLLREPGRDGRLGRPPGRLRQPVRAQHGVQARARHEPARAPRGGGRDGTQRGGRRPGVLARQTARNFAARWPLRPSCLRAPASASDCCCASPSRRRRSRPRSPGSSAARSAWRSGAATPSPCAARRRRGS